MAAIGAGGLSRPRLARLDEAMRGYVERGELAGVVTLVSRRDDLLLPAARLILEPGPGRRHM